MNALDYQLTFEDRSTYLYVRLTGEDSFAASLSYWNEIADQVKLRGCDKILIHENMVDKVNETEMYDIITDVLPTGLEEVQIAFYDDNLEEGWFPEKGEPEDLPPTSHPEPKRQIHRFLLMPPSTNDPMPGPAVV